jgi:hypothetical protein
MNQFANSSETRLSHTMQRAYFILAGCQKTPPGSKAFVPVHLTFNTVIYNVSLNLPKPLANFIYVTQMSLGLDFAFKVHPGNRPMW